MLAPAPLLAPAKVNLYLHVLGRRADGYHDLDSLFVRVGLADRIWLRPADQDRLEVTGPFASTLDGDNPADNLVMCALALARRETGRGDHFHVTLEKNIPVAAGLGGGSADAAAVLNAMPDLFGRALDLEALARELGADVLPCLIEAPILVSGTGDVVALAPSLPACALVLVNPRLPLATPAVFAARTGPFSASRSLIESAPTLDALLAALASRGNDLEAAACGLAPVIGACLEALAACPAVGLTRMSGSGATCFGLVASLAEARHAAQAIAGAHPDWWVEATPLLGGPDTTLQPM
ncbi:MAG: 4-(cytidine 5'-diphospho)-2-C-methyl-D-erythritol kinase [Rhodospirillaceae bacterium]|nr:4-(cytidine 5'-diphospho)-2-C-methyl-D-erythritol kinase [Rhodospirillaceae bacterium]MBT6205327.1 4-(cytidine 5'-diphospho)-2-C-methyl-D-erythritol kinase [Rhodospirillaceae bacterium]MBT7646873.1 4-(cytidine 5'-diphospho)-2-C-methyl-D-erythritol kinase [Rhodospirillaceae bacterium]